MFTPQEQLQYELDNDAKAASDRMREFSNQALAGNVDLPRAQRLLSAAFGAARDSILEVQASKARGLGGAYRAWIKALPADLIAVLSIRICLSILLAPNYKKDKPVTIQRLAREVGRAIELERRIYEAERVNPVFMQQVHETLKKGHSTDSRFIRNTYLKAYETVLEDAVESNLSATEAVNIGKFGVEACMRAGLVQCRHTVGSKGSMVLYEIPPDILAALTDYNDTDVMRVVDTSAQAMLCPPQPWRSLTDGGYYSPRRRLVLPLMSLKKIRKSERKRLREEFTPERMPQVFECANYLQSVPYVVHTPTLRAIQKVWAQGGNCMGVPSRTPPQTPPFPLPPTWVRAESSDEDMQVYWGWAAEARRAYDDATKWRATVRELSGFLRHSRRVPEGHPMWFPVFMDTRNRWYYRGSPNPQGTDLAKSVLHFAEKRPLGQRGLFWLKVAVASNSGFDKERFVQRAAWTDEHWPAIERALDAPEDAPEVFGEDAPWCVFSAAWELREALRSPNPAEYETGIPVHMDATCSGIQHLSAMLRDPVGGRFVNLYDESFVGPKQDIYGEVGNSAFQAVLMDLQHGDETQRLCAQFWIDRGGIERALAKKPVMTYVYGATLRGTAQYVLEYLEDAGVDFPKDSVCSRYTLCLYLAKKLFQGIGATVPAAEYLMHWFKQTTRNMPKGKRMEWRNPVGFLVQHDYQTYEDTRVKLRSCGVDQIILREFTDGIKATAMQNAISPNFVHSMDACHLTLTALAMRDNQAQMVGIHDSFGTHPCDVDLMHQCIRTSFVKLYADRSLLASFLLDLGLSGEAPMQGTLDLDRVLSSEFFFC